VLIRSLVDALGLGMAYRLVLQDALEPQRQAANSGYGDWAVAIPF
jgi:hypothetical protein